MKMFDSSSSLTRRELSRTKFVLSWVDNFIYYTLNSLSLFWLAESVQLIFEVRACDVIPADYSMSRSRVIMSRSQVIMWCMTAVYDFSGSLALFCFSVSEEAQTSFFLFRSVYNKTIIRFGFCDIQNNQGLGKGYQPKPKAWLFWISQKPHPIIVYYTQKKIPSVCLV